MKTLLSLPESLYAAQEHVWSFDLAPGQHILKAQFDQTTWPDVDEDICEFSMEFFVNGESLGRRTVRDNGKKGLKINGEPNNDWWMACKVNLAAAAVFRLTLKPYVDLRTSVSVVQQ